MDSQRCHVPAARTKGNPEKSDVWKSEMSKVGGQGGRRTAASSPNVGTDWDKKEVGRREDSTRVREKREKEAEITSQESGNEEEPLLKEDVEAYPETNGGDLSDEQEQDDETEVQGENEGVELQVLKRKAEQRRGDDETSPEDRLQMTKDISQAGENKEEKEISGEIETNSGLPMPYTKKDGSQTVTNMTRLTTQLGDTMRLMEQTGDPTSTSGMDDWKEAVVLLCRVPKGREARQA